MLVPSDQIKPQHMWCIDTAVETHGRFYLIDTHRLSTTMITEKEYKTTADGSGQRVAVRATRAALGGFHPTIALLEWCLLCSAGPRSILADDISLLWAWFVYCRSESWPGCWEATVYSVWSQMTDGLLLHTWNSRLTLNTEHLADFQRSTPDFTKRADNSFSVGFREEGTTVQNGLFITFKNRENLLSSNHNQNAGRVRSH